MQPNRFRNIFTILVVLTVLVAVYGPIEATPQKLKFAYVSPDPIGVNPFLSMGQKGIELAGKQHGSEVKVFESEDPTTREENVRAAINDGANLVVVLGFQFNDMIPKIAAEFPDVQFLIVDQCIENLPPNVRCAVFREYEGSFLIGVIAASLTKTNHVGTVCALDIPFMHRFTDGFAQGAKYIKPNIKVSTLWVGGNNPFADPVRAKELALALAANGADYIFAVTSGGDFEIFEAAQEKNFFVFGVDVNLCPTTPGRIIDCQLKRVDVAIVESIDAILNKSEDKVMVYGLNNQGVGLVSLTSEKPEESQCVIAQYPDVIAKVKALQQKIINGDIVIKDPMFAQ
jgi:basic membrane protein A